MTAEKQSDLRLIEAGFPCHQVGAENERERATSSQPATTKLHVWWARRPLTPSRAAILASLLPADTDPDWFLRQLGIEKRIVAINGQQWTLTGKILDKVETASDGSEVLPVDTRVLDLLEKESRRRAENREIIAQLKNGDTSLANDPVLQRWEVESQAIDQPWPRLGDALAVKRVAADPAWFKDLMSIAGAHGVRVPNLYGYNRAYLNAPEKVRKPFTVLDPTAGGGSIPFEALRLGHKVIANELNPVAAVILHATLEYPARFGKALVADISLWGNRLLSKLDSELDPLFPREHKLPDFELKTLLAHLSKSPELAEHYNAEKTTSYLYCRQVTCPHCGSQAPLLNTCWLSKEAGRQWGVAIVTDGKTNNGSVRFETYRVTKGKGPKGEDPNFATVKRGVGQCIHCRQAIDADEIKKQARGESGHGKWQDRLYCVVAVRFQPKLDKHGQPLRFKSGEKKGQIKTQKVRFFRPPNQRDLDALVAAEKRLAENWERWDAEGLIPTESIPEAHKTKEPLRVGMTRWCDMFTPRQLLGHLTLAEELNRLKPQIIAELGKDKGRAVVTYLQFAIDRGVDYNSQFTIWISNRGGVIGHTFSRHDYAIKWTFGEMIFVGPESGINWCIDQTIKAYKGLAKLIDTVSPNLCPIITNGTAAYMNGILDESVDLICIDPPYYNNVQYAELSDYFYVWQKRTLKDLYSDLFSRRLTNKRDEAVANPDRDGGTVNAKHEYERMMGEIFTECHRVIKDTGLMTLMFTHKSQNAWEALTISLIASGWQITSSSPVDTEFSDSMNQKNMAAAASSVFLSCRKRLTDSDDPATWTGIGGTGIQKRIQEAVKQGLKEFEQLKLNPVDEMVASYGRALRVLSERWPVLDGDKKVGPIRAMNEASRVVAENQIRRLTGGRLRVDDLSPEAAMALTLFGIYGLAELPYDDALNISKSLSIRLENKVRGYSAEGRFIGINTQARAGSRAKLAGAEDTGFHAPLIRRGSKLRLARPEERDPRRLENPQTEWDMLHGVIMACREGDIPVARGYLDRHADHISTIRDLLQVWAAEAADETLRKEAQALLFGLK